MNWNLKEVTPYPGICNNYPAYNTSPDAGAELVFDPALQQNGAFASVNEASATTKTGAGNGAAAVVMCKDYAAWGRLTASVTLDDGTTIDAIPYYRLEDSA